MEKWKTPYAFKKQVFEKKSQKDVDKGAQACYYVKAAAQKAAEGQSTLTNEQ